MPDRHIIQITATGVEASQFTQCEVMLFGLCSDGSVVMSTNRDSKWEEWGGPLPIKEPNYEF